MSPGVGFLGGVFLFFSLVVRFVCLFVVCGFSADFDLV